MAYIQMLAPGLQFIHLRRISRGKIFNLLEMWRKVCNHQSIRKISQATLYGLHRKEYTKETETRGQAICGQSSKRLTWLGRFRKRIQFGRADARLKREREGLVLYDYKCEAIRNLRWE